MDASWPVEEAYISVGSNIDPERHILAALRLLAAEVEVARISTFYRTAPLPDPNGVFGPDAAQEHYINGVWCVRTNRGPFDLKFEVLRGIEHAMGRSRGLLKFAPRVIDLDLVMYGAMATQEPGLELPDPDIRTRAFVAAPLLEIAPDLVLPGTGERLDSLAVAHELREMEPLPDFTEALRRSVGEAAARDRMESECC